MDVAFSVDILYLIWGILIIFSTPIPVIYMNYCTDSEWIERLSILLSIAILVIGIAVVLRSFYII